MKEAPVKRLTMTDEVVRPREFDFSGGGTLHIMSCAPVATESGFWRKLKNNEPS